MASIAEYEAFSVLALVFFLFFLIFFLQFCVVFFLAHFWIGSNWAVRAGRLRPWSTTPRRVRILVDY